MSGETRGGFTTRALLSSVAAWMDEHPLTAPLVASVRVNDLSMEATGFHVDFNVHGDVVELGIMCDALDVERTGHLVQQMDDAYSDSWGRERWWRQGAIHMTRPDGQRWAVTVTRELAGPPAPAPSQDCGNCDGGHTGDAYCSQSTAGLLQ